MIVSVNPEPHRREFDTLLGQTVRELNDRAQKFSLQPAALKGRDLEPYVKDLMSELAKGTPFESSIQLIGGQKFPDIVAKRYYGIEVKTTTQNHWKTTGNSILESTRVDDVERVFMLFAKLASPIEFRYRPYEEVLSEIVVTHSPRYLIDMELSSGHTIFDKINMPYDVLRKQDNPIRPIVDYYKNNLKPGEELWWMDSTDTENASKMVIRMWGNLPKTEKQALKTRAMVYFPELFGASSDKYAKLAVWLVTCEAVVCSNLRDTFTAGGRIDYEIMGRVFENLPRVFQHLFDDILKIHEVLIRTPATKLSEYWERGTTEQTKLSDWIERVANNANGIRGMGGLNLKAVLVELMQT